MAKIFIIKQLTGFLIAVILVLMVYVGILLISGLTPKSTADRFTSTDAAEMYQNLIELIQERAPNEK